MSDEKSGGPAFPVHGGDGHSDPRNQIIGGGMTLRDYFAAKAMIYVAQDGSWRNNQFNPRDNLSTMENNAALAYMIADAMIRERAK